MARTEAERVRDAAQARLRRRAKRLSGISVAPGNSHVVNPSEIYGRLPTPRELTALAEAAIHGNEKEAAACLGLSHQTIKNSISGAHQRLGTSNIAQALVRVGWVVIPRSVRTSIHE